MSNPVILSFDTALSYKSSSILEQLKQATPDGIDVYFDDVYFDDVYFDTVSGGTLEESLSVLHRNGRSIACGSISEYND